MLLHHRTLLVSVALAGFLAALAAASSPLVTTATASAALKNKLVGLAPLATGLEVSGRLESFRPGEGLEAVGRRRAEASRRLSARLGLERPVLTLESSMPGAVLNGNSDTRVTLLARTGVFGHVRMLARTGGAGVWISDLTASSTGLRPGGVLRLEYSTPGGAARRVGLRVKGIYRALDLSPPDPYWANFVEEIFPRGVDPPPPQRYVLMSARDLYRAESRLSTVRTYRYRGRSFRYASGPPLEAIAEMAVDPDGLTLPRARALAERFAALEHDLARSALGQDLGCAGPGKLTTSREVELLCSVSSSLSAAVILANDNAAAISPIVSLLSAAAIAITLAVACAAGVFLVRRRRAEAALVFARGEHVAGFTARSLLEMLGPLLLGAAAGFAASLALTGLFAPTGSVDGATVGSAAIHAAVGTAAALALAAVGAAVVYLHLFDTGTVRRRWLRWLPWELPLLAIAGWYLHRVLTGGGVAESAGGSGSHPTLAVFALPLLLVAAATGLATRGLRPLLGAAAAHAGGLPTPLFLALRRASAASLLLGALLVVAAVCFGAYFYAEALAASVSRSVDEKGYIAYGGDVQGLVSDETPSTPRFRYPVTTVAYGNQAATIGGATGAAADVLAVDPATLGAVIRWYPDWGPDPRSRLNQLAGPASGPLPVIATRNVPAQTGAISIQGVRLPVRVIARVSAFPGMSVGVPLLVVAGGALEAAASEKHLLNPLGVTQNYVWARGPPQALVAALEAPPFQAFYLTSVDEFRHDPDVLLAKRSFSYLRLLAAASGALVFIGLLLYLQARQRSQAVASALAARMGLRASSETFSLALELAAIALVAAILGGLVALLTAIPIIGHIDALPENPPAPAAVIPVTAIVLALLGLLLLTLVAGAVTSWLSRRTDMSEALRVA